MNIEHIEWKIFLRHVPNNLQLGYHRSPLDIVMACGSCEFLVHKVAKSPCANYYPIWTRGSTLQKIVYEISTSFDFIEITLIVKFAYHKC